MDLMDPQGDKRFNSLQLRQQTEKCNLAVELWACELRIELENGPKSEEFDPDVSFVYLPYPRNYDKLRLEHRVPICHSLLNKIRKVQRITDVCSELEPERRFKNSSKEQCGAGRRIPIF